MNSKRYLARNGAKDAREQRLGSGGPKLSENLGQSIENIQRELGNSPDLKVRQIQIGGVHPVQAAAVHLSGLADTVAVNEFVVGSLLDNTAGLTDGMDEADRGVDLPARILSSALEIGEADFKEEWNDIMLAVLSGDTAILVEGYTSAIVCDTRGGEQRSVSEPSSQLVVRGPKDGFVESVGTNIALIRRRIKSPKLRLEYMKIGSETQTHVAIMYMKEIAGEDLVQEVRDRLHKIAIDEVLESGFLEELIQDKTFTPFPTIYNSERPDVAAGNLLEGRVVVIVDGTPFVLILPAVFTQFFSRRRIIPNGSILQY